MRRLANLCLSVGAAVAVLGVIGVALGFRPSELPSALLDIAAYKLVFIAASGLVVAGAILGRAARRDVDGRTSSAEPDVAMRNLQPGDAPDDDAGALDPVKDRVRQQR